MGRLAFVFPGQGSQSVGMAGALATAWPQAAAVFAELDDVLGEPLRHLIAEGPAEELGLTENAQPALLATSIAFLRALQMRAADAATPLRPAFAAGHSMGQYSALVAANAISLGDGLRLVRERGRLMQASGEGRPGAMCAILGLDDTPLDELLERASAAGVIGIANRNAPGQIVLSGERSAVEAGAGIARELGARKVVILPVSVAAHSPLMLEAAAAMARALAAVEFADPVPVLISNAGARTLATAADARAELVEHLTAGVDWVAAVRAMAATGVDTFIEVGPGRVLTGLIKRIATDARALALDDASAPDGLSEAAVDAALAASTTGPAGHAAPGLMPGRLTAPAATHPAPS